jgi:hypothetical protein
LAECEWVDMKVYGINSGDGYELCHPKDENDFGSIATLVNGRERRRTWSPIRMRIIKEDERVPLRESDSPWLGSYALIFRPRAVNALRSLLEVSGELLPLAPANAGLQIYNPTFVVDALDEDRSKLTRSDGYILIVYTYIFRPEVIRNLPIFKISNLRVSPTFVDESFVSLWKASGLKGLDFTQVWEEN